MKKKEGFKETKLGWIPEDWEVKKLGDLCNNAKGEYGINASAVPFKKDLPAYLRITDIDENGQYVKVKKASVDDINYKKFILKDGDIVFARTGATVGKTYLYNDKDGLLVYAGFLIKFTPNNEKLNRWYLKHFTDTHKYWNWVKVTSVRSGQPGINGMEYSTMNLSIPPIPEQKAIANCLSTWDTAITKQDALIKAKQQLKKALMQQLLSGKKRLSGFSEEWDERKLGDYLEQSSQKVTLENTYEVFTSARRGLVKQSEYYESGRLTLKSSIGFNIIKTNELTYRSRTDDGSFKFNLNTLKIDGCVSKYYPVLKSRTSVEFFNYFLNFYNKKIGLFATGSSQLVLSFKELSKIVFKLPEAKEQIAIAKVLNMADNEINLLINQRNQLQLQKKGLMQQLLTGKKRLKV